MILVADEALMRQAPAWSAEFDELVDLEGDGTWCGRAWGLLDMSVSGDRLRVAGALEGRLPRACDLCLGQYLEPVITDLDEVCVVGGEAETATFDEDAEVWRVAPEGRFSVTEAVRQALLLALPTKADCGSECPGRATLSRYRQRGETTDPRLAALRELFKPEVEDDGRPETTN